MKLTHKDLGKQFVMNGNVVTLVWYSPGDTRCGVTDGTTRMNVDSSQLTPLTPAS